AALLDRHRARDPFLDVGDPDADLVRAGDAAVGHPRGGRSAVEHRRRHRRVFRPLLHDPLDDAGRRHRRGADRLHPPAADRRDRRPLLRRGVRSAGDRRRGGHLHRHLLQPVPRAALACGGLPDVASATQNSRIGDTGRRPSRITCQRMSNWQQVLRAPADGDHIVQVYQDREFLASAVAEYVAAGLAKGEAAIVVARPEHAAAFRDALSGRDVDVAAALGRGQLVVLDAQATLDRFMRDGVPQWTPFHEVIGGAIAELRLRFPAVRAYGEMVDILWQQGERDAAILLEEHWNELASLQTFSLFCAYYLDNLDDRAYG